MERKLEQLQGFLESNDLGEYYDAITNQLKIKSVTMLKFASEGDLVQIGMSRPQIKMLFDCYKKEQSALGKLKRMFVAGRTKSKPAGLFSNSSSSTSAESSANFSNSSNANLNSSNSLPNSSFSGASLNQNTGSSSQSVGNDYVIAGVPTNLPIAAIVPTVAENCQSVGKTVDLDTAASTEQSGASVSGNERATSSLHRNDKSRQSGFANSCRVGPLFSSMRASNAVPSVDANSSTSPDKPARGTQTQSGSDAALEASFDVGIDSEQVRAAAGCRLIAASEIQLCKSVGIGEFATVYEARWRVRDSEERAVAVKVLHRERLQNNACEFLREAQLALRIAHNHIVRLFGVVLDGDSLMLVAELAAHKSLLECLRDPLLSRQFALPTLVRFATQISDAMRYLEQRRLVHRDLAARNVLVFAIDVVKVSDFGMSRALSLGNEYYRAHFSADLKLPIAWCAPECINYLKFTSASDVWAFGVTLWEMFSYGEQPWRGLDAADILSAIDEPRCERLSRPPLCPTDFYELLNDCWQQRLENRPSFERIHSCFTRGDCRITQLQSLADAQIHAEDSESTFSLLQYQRGDIVYLIDRSPADSPSHGLWYGVLANNPKAAGFFEPQHFVTETSQHSESPLASARGATGRRSVRRQEQTPFADATLRRHTATRRSVALASFDRPFGGGDSTTVDKNAGMRQSNFASNNVSEDTIVGATDALMLPGHYDVVFKARSGRRNEDANIGRGQVNRAAAFSNSSSESINAVVNGDGGDRLNDLDLNLLNEVLQAFDDGDAAPQSEASSHAAPRLRGDGEEDENSNWQFTQTWPIVAPAPMASRAETGKRNKLRLKLELEPNSSDASYPAALHEPLLVSASASDGGSSSMRALSSSAEKKLDNAIALAEECAAKSNASLNERHPTPHGSAGSVREQAQTLATAVSGSPNSSSVVTVSTVKSSDSDRDERDRDRERESGGSSPTRKKPPFRIAFRRRASATPRVSTSPKGTVNRVLFSFTDEMEARLQRGLALSPTDVDAYNALVDKRASATAGNAGETQLRASCDDVQLQKLRTSTHPSSSQPVTVGPPPNNSPKVMGRLQSGHAHAHAHNHAPQDAMGPRRLLRDSGSPATSMRVPPRRSNIAMPSGALLPSRGALPNADSASSSSGVSSNANASANFNTNPLPVPPRIRSAAAFSQGQSNFIVPVDRHTIARIGTGVTPNASSNSTSTSNSNSNSNSNSAVARCLSAEEQVQLQSNVSFQRDYLRTTVSNSRISANDSRRNSMPLEPPPAPPLPASSSREAADQTRSNGNENEGNTAVPLNDTSDRLNSQSQPARVQHGRTAKNGVGASAGDALSGVQRAHNNSPKHELASSSHRNGLSWSPHDDIQLDTVESGFFTTGVNYDDRNTNTRNRNTNGGSSPRTQRLRTVRR